MNPIQPLCHKCGRIVRPPVPVLPGTIIVTRVCDHCGTRSRIQTRYNPERDRCPSVRSTPLPDAQQEV
jgi:lysyl-tRNA synthetase class I